MSDKCEAILYENLQKCAFGMTPHHNSTAKLRHKHWHYVAEVREKLGRFLANAVSQAQAAEDGAAPQADSPAPHAGQASGQ